MYMIVHVAKCTPTFAEKPTYLRQSCSWLKCSRFSLVSCCFMTMPGVCKYLLMFVNKPPSCQYMRDENRTKNYHLNHQCKKKWNTDFTTTKTYPYLPVVFGGFQTVFATLVGREGAEHQIEHVKVALVLGLWRHARFLQQVLADLSCRTQATI